MNETRYIALLRGINVGGNNIIRMREGVDRAWAGEGVLYFSVLISRATQSYLSKIVGQPIYQSLTIRNWNTNTKLLSK